MHSAPTYAPRNVVSISSANYQLLFEANPLPTYVFEKDTLEFLAVNKAAIEHYGYSRDAFRKMLVSELHLAKDFKPVFKKLALDKAVKKCCTQRKKDGTVIDVEITFQSVDFENTEAVLCIAVDVTEQRKTTEALKKSEANLKALIDNAQEAIWAVDKNHRISFMNNIYKKLTMYHYGKEPHIGMKIYKYFPEKVKEAWLARFNRAFSGERFTLDWHFDIGEYSYDAEVSVTPIYDDAGNATGVAYFSRDITERKRAIEQLQIREEQYRSLIENMTEGVAIVNADMQLMFANDRFYKMTGYEPADVKDENLPSILFDKKNSASLIKKLTSGRLKPSQHHELRIKKKDSSHLWAIINSSPLSLGNELNATLLTITDITERKQNEEKLKTNEIKYRTLVEAINEGVMQVDINDNITFVNNRVCEMLGYNEDELLGKSSLEIFKDESSKETLEAQMPLRIIGRSSQYEVIVQKKNGDHLPVIVNGTPVYNQTGELVGTMGTITDISDLKKTEERLRTANKELNTFVYKASHDIRGPLASVIGLTELAHYEVEDKPALELIHKIKKGAYRLDNILSELLDTLRIKEGVIQVESITLEEFCRSVLANHATSEGFDQIRFNVNVKQNIEFCSDKKILWSLINNLVDNAIKYRDKMKETSFVNINVINNSTKVYISIQDNGVGIIKSAQDKVFDMFYRASLSSKGSGLGLYIVKNAVERLDGSIRLESTEGKGTTVIVELPNKQKEQIRIRG